MISFDASELSNWADKPEARNQLPQLLRQLILATSHPTRSEFASGSSVDLPGWDGILEVETGNAWVPTGSSRWELSAEKRPRTKANADYEKRTGDPIDVDPSETVFVFATPRRWPAKTKWIEERRRETPWREIRVLDADDLVAWLDAAPSVATLFAKFIGKLPPSGVMSLSDWWENWVGATDPQISPGLVLAGREKSVEQIAQWIAETPAPLVVKGDTATEAIAFLAASALHAANDWGEDALVRSLVVSTQEAWQSLERSQNRLLLIRDVRGDFAANVAIDAGHHVLVPLHHEEPCGGDTCSLPRLGRDESREALIAMGIPRSRVSILQRTSARRLPVLRRRLAGEIGPEPPSWASQSAPHCLVALLLVGQWDEDFGNHDPVVPPNVELPRLERAAAMGDRQIIEQITGFDYENLVRELTALLDQPDSPLIKVGSKWRLASHEEAWHLLAPRLSSADTERFETMAADVFGSLSPEFDMPPDERYAAAVYGRTLRHSETLRQGIMRALALMGAHADRATSVVSTETIAARIVAKVFANGADWHLWATLDRDLPTLAEAAPEAFLDAVERGLALEPSPFHELLTQNDGSIFSGVPHAGALWALEQLAWGQDHFSRVALILARLAAFAPDTVSNHPRESLQSLFERGLRFTEAADSHRLNTLEMLFAREPGIAWAALIAIVPQDGRGIILRDPPQWRPWGHDSPAQVTVAEHQAFLKALHDLLLEHVGADAQRWTDVINAFAGIQRDVQRELITLMSQHVDVLHQHASAATLRHKLRTLLNLHRRHRDAARAMDEDELTTLGAVYQSLTPADPIAAASWLFTDWPALPDVPLTDADPRDYRVHAKRIANERRNAVQDVFGAAGVAGIEALCDAAEHSYFVGVAVADGLDLQDASALAIQHATSPSDVMRQFAHGVFERIGINLGWPALNSVLNEVRALDGNDDLIAAIYCAAPADSRVWRDVSNEPDAVQATYWAKIDARLISVRDTAEADDAALRLLAARRSWDVVWLAHNFPLSSEMIVHVLWRLPLDQLTLLTTDMPGYYVAKCLEALDSDEAVPDEVIAGLEVPFIDVLRHDRTNLALHRTVLASPSLFADLVSWCSRRSDGQSDEPIDERVRQICARNAFHILEHLTGVPGLQPDGTINDAVLSQWVAETRRLCRERGRESSADDRIGHMLASSPVGSDGMWPCEPVRDILDSIASQSAGQGFHIGTKNRRGVTMRGPFDGGDQERTLAEQYQHDAKQIAGRWPFTAQILRSLASSYNREGQHEDHEAEWRDLSE